MAEDASSGGAAPPLDKAADRIRETSKWLIATFAAVGGALIAGSQLSSIGSLAPANWMRFAIAAAGVLIAILGVAWAIAAAVRVAVAGSVNLAGLAALPQSDAVRTRLEEDEALMAGYRSLGALATDYAEAVAHRKQTYDAYIADRSQPVSDPSKLEDAKTAAANATFLSQTVQNVLSVGSFEAVATEFKKSRRDLFVGAAAAAAGILAFAAAANPADKDSKFSSPAITATLSDAATSLNASFVADSLASDEQLRIWITGEPDRRTLYRASFGPDSSGEVKRTVQLPLGFSSRTQRLVLRAWKSGADPAQCEMGAGSRAANKTACAVLSLPTLDLRPRLIASWEGATLVVKVGSGAVAADRALALRVVAVSSEDRLRLYGANLAPQQGNVDETVKLHVPAGFKTVCAEAMIVPPRETIFARALATRKRWEACPQRRADQLAWVRLAVPDPAG